MSKRNLRTLNLKGKSGKKLVGTIKKDVIAQIISELKKPKSKVSKAINCKKKIVINCDNKKNTKKAMHILNKQSKCINAIKKTQKKLIKFNSQIPSVMSDMIVRYLDAVSKSSDGQFISKKAVKYVINSDTVRSTICDYDDSDYIGESADTVELD